MSDQPVVITQRDIYELLVKVERAVADGAIERRRDAQTIADHETRLREIEARENLTARVAAVETALTTDRAEADDRLTAIERRVWAIPGASVVISGAALVVVLIRWL